MRVWNRQSVLGLSLVGILVGCGSKPEPAAPAPVTQRETGPTGQGDVSTPRPPADPDAEARARRATIDRLRATMGEMIFYDYDRSDLRSESRSALDRKLAILDRSPGVRIRIAGHADERGSDEYNLALGMRRATAAQRYLAQHGVAASRVEVVSFGEERPLEGGHDESAWGRNRRAEFEIIAGEVQP